MQAERITRAQLIDGLAQDEHGKYKVDRVSCVHEQDGQFECRASASRSYSGLSVGQSSSNTDKSFGGTTAVLESDMTMGIVFCDEKRCTSEPAG